MIIRSNYLRVKRTRNTETIQHGDKVLVPSTKEIYVKYFPMSGRELERLDEGRRTKRNIKGSTSERLNIKDIIEPIDGGKFEVQVVSGWPNRYKFEAVEC